MGVPAGARPGGVGARVCWGLPVLCCGVEAPRRRLDVKKLIALVAVAGVVLFIVRRQRSAKAEADLWREATAPTD